MINVSVVILGTVMIGNVVVGSGGSLVSTTALDTNGVGENMMVVICIGILDVSLLVSIIRLDIVVNKAVVTSTGVLDVSIS